MRSSSIEQSAAIQCLAVVGAVDGVRFLATAPCPADLWPRVAAYVAEQAPRKLWPGDAERIRVLLSRGELEMAIERYFASVGDRWDEEWLHTENITLEERHDHVAVPHHNADAVDTRSTLGSPIARDEASGTGHWYPAG